MRTRPAAAFAAAAFIGCVAGAWAADDADDAVAADGAAVERALVAPAVLPRIDQWSAGDVMLGAGPPAGAQWPAMLAPDGSLLMPGTADSLADKGRGVTFFDLEQARIACGASPDCLPDESRAGDGLIEAGSSSAFPVPLPTALVLLGAAMALLALFRRRARG